MRLKLSSFIVAFIITLAYGNSMLAVNNYYKDYLQYKQLISNLRILGNSDKNLQVETLLTTTGGKEMVLFKAQSKAENPAIFVSANMSGVLPITSSGALYLADLLAENPELYADYTWYILPCGNPDAYLYDLNQSGFPYNLSITNNDMDDQKNEDGPDDLNKDGVISMMRVKDPLGKYVIHAKENRLLDNAKADCPSNQRYSVYTEGLDNDGDGFYNEDPKGGVNIARTFPYNYEYYKPEFGTFSGSETETRVLLAFFSEHPEVCMTITLGESDFLRSDFIKESKSTAAKKYKLPSRIAGYVGVSATESHTIVDWVEIINEAQSEYKVDENTVMSFIGGGPLKAPLSTDAKDYKTLSASFKTHIKNNALPYKFIEPIKAQSGSFELYSYYHLGLPSIAMRLFDVPDLSPDSVKSKTKLSRKEAFLKYNDSILGGAGFLDWTKTDHPDFGSVEVGGCKQNYITNPLSKDIEASLSSQITWLKTLPDLLPKLSVDSISSKSLGKSTYRIEVFVKNSGKIAAPLSIGAYTKRPAPIILKIDDAKLTFIEGKKRTLVKQVKADQVNKYTFVLNTTQNEISFDLEAKNVSCTSKTIKLK